MQTSVTTSRTVQTPPYAPLRIIPYASSLFAIFRTVRHSPSHILPHSPPHRTSQSIAVRHSPSRSRSQSVAVRRTVRHSPARSPSRSSLQSVAQSITVLSQSVAVRHSPPHSPSQSVAQKLPRSFLRNRNRGKWTQKSWGGNNTPQWTKGKQEYTKGGGKGIKDGGKKGWKQGQKGGKPGKKGENIGKGKSGKGKTGKAKGGTKGGGKWPSTWARVDKQGKEYCQNFHFRGGCNNNQCLRSHKCPKQDDAMTWICNQDHKADYCPTYQ